MLTIGELTTASTTTQIFNSMIAWLVSQGLPANLWRPGGVARSILMVVAVTFAILSALIADFAAGAYLDTSTGDWLTNLALYVYGVSRPQATYATGTVLASNSSGGTYTYQPGEWQVETDNDSENPGVFFLNTAAFTLAPGASLVPVPVIATVLGSGNNAAPGDVIVVVAPDSGVTVTNTTAIVGQDAMSDPNLVLLCKAKLGALSMAGPRGAYEYGIQTALDNGSPVNVNRWSISPSSSTGIVQVYLASPSGIASAGDVAAVAANLQAVAVPDCVTCLVDSASVVDYTNTLTVWAITTPGLSESILSDQVNAALIAFVSNYYVGGLPKPPSSQGYLYAEAIDAAATAANPAIFAIDNSEGDLLLNAGEVAALATTLIVRFVTAPTS
jgi:hypothetical protein